MQRIPWPSVQVDGAGSDTEHSAQSFCDTWVLDEDGLPWLKDGNGKPR